jgi:hypothetical protein
MVLWPALLEFALLVLVLVVMVVLVVVVVVLGPVIPIFEGQTIAGMVR